MVLCRLTWGALQAGGRACPVAMDQDYERRLLRQIVIQNENTVPGVSVSDVPHV